MKLATSFAALAAGMLALGACSDDKMASDNTTSSQEASRDPTAYPADRTYSTDRTAPSPLPNDAIAPANPDDVTPPPPSPGSPPPPLPPT